MSSNLIPVSQKAVNSSPLSPTPWHSSSFFSPPPCWRALLHFITLLEANLSVPLIIFEHCFFFLYLLYFCNWRPKCILYSTGKCTTHQYSSIKLFSNSFSKHSNPSISCFVSLLSIRADSFIKLCELVLTSLSRTGSRRPNTTLSQTALP